VRSTLFTLAKRPWAGPAIILAIGSLVYANSFKGVFVYDEVYSIVDNPSIKSLRFWDYEVGSNRPVGYLTFALNYAVGGLDPRGYHVVNLAIHLAAAWLIFALVRDTLARGRLATRYGPSARGLALAVALIWLVHPLQTQSVTYVCQRLESLMALFYLLTLYAFTRAQGSTQPVAWYAVSVVGCGLGMGTKEVMVTAPLAVLWYDRAFIAESWRAIGRRRWPYYTALAATWGVLAFLMFAQGKTYVEAGVFDVPGLSPLDYGLNQSAVVLHYLRLAFWPSGLCLEYNWPVAQTTLEILPSLLCMAALLALTAWAIVRRPALGFVAGSFFLILAPTSSIAPIRDLAYEHRMYLPLAPLVILSVIAAHRAWERAVFLSDKQSRFWQTRVALVGLAGVVAALGIATIVRNEAYRSGLVFWDDNVKKAPLSPKARNNLARYLLEAERPREAVEQMNALIELQPDWAMAYLTRGYALQKLGRFELAIKNFDRAIELKPGDAEAFYSRGQAYRLLGKRERAIADFTRAIELKPDHAKAYTSRGACYLEAERYADALADVTKAIQLKPDLAEAYTNRAVYFFTQKQYDQAWIDVHQARKFGVPPSEAFIRDLASASGHSE